MIPYVTTGAELRVIRVTKDARERGAVRRCSFMSSGQITPTAAGVWHSGQMVRPHRWHSTKLCRSGCR